MERFDPAAGGRWVALGGDAAAGATGLATPRKYAAASAWGGRLVVAGGVDGRRVRLGSVEALDPREGHRWSPLPPLACPRSGAGLAVCAAAGGALVVAGGTGAAGGPLGSVEALLAGGREWVERAPLAVPRSGLALVAL